MYLHKSNDTCGKKYMKSATGISEVFSELTKMTWPKSPAAYCALVQENHKKSVMVETMK